MITSVEKAICVVVIVFFFPLCALSQWYTIIPLKIRMDDKDSVIVKFGFDYSATHCVDSIFNENEVALSQADTVFSVRFLDPRSGNCFGNGLSNDIRSEQELFFSQSGIDTFRLHVTGRPRSTSGYYISWPDIQDNNYPMLRIVDPIGGFVTNVDMRLNTQAVLNASFMDYYIYFAPIWDIGGSVDNVGITNDGFHLDQNYPNPFNPITTIRFYLIRDGLVTVKIYNILGKEIAVLADNKKYQVGENRVIFNASDLPSGIYYYLLTVNGNEYREMKKMVFLK